MNTKTRRMVRGRLKAPAIYKSEHEPFLPGNIAMRGVIGKISRKAISPLAEVDIKSCKTKAVIFLLFLKSHPWLYGLSYPPGRLPLYNKPGHSDARIFRSSASAGFLACD